MQAGFLLLLLIVAASNPVSSLLNAVPGAETAVQIYNHMPRIYGNRLDPSMVIGSSYADINNPTMKAYAIGTAALTGFGLLFGVVSLLGGIIFCICRYGCKSCKSCRCRCCAQTEKLSPIKLLVSVFISSLLTVGSVATLWYYTMDLNAELISNTSGHLWGDAELTIDHSLQAIDLANSTIIGLPNRIVPVETDLQQTILAMQLIDVQTSQLISFLSLMAVEVDVATSITVAPRAAGAAYVSGDATWSCSNCASIHAQLQSTKGVIDSYRQGVNPTISSLQQVIDNVEKARSDLAKATNDISSQLTFYHGSVSDKTQSLKEKKKQIVDSYEPIGLAVLIALMCLPLGGFLAIVGGTYTKKGPAFCGAAVLAWLTLTLFSLGFAGFLPLTSGVSDGCVVLNYAETHLKELTSSSTVDDAVRQCLSNSSLATDLALNLTGQVRQLQEPYEADNNMTSHVSDLSLTPLTASMAACSAKLATLTTGSFAVNDSKIDDDIGQLNQIVAQYLTPPIVYGRTTLETVDDTTPGATASQHDQVMTLKYSALQLMDGLVAVNAYVNDVKNNATVAALKFSALTLTVRSAQISLLEVPKLVNGVFDGLVASLVEIFWCGWLGDDYKSLKAGLCNRLTLDLGIISLTLFSSIITLVPTIFLATILSKRILEYGVPPPSPSPSPVPTPAVIELFPRSFSYDEFGNIASLENPSNISLHNEPASLENPSNISLHNGPAIARKSIQQY